MKLLVVQKEEVESIYTIRRGTDTYITVAGVNEFYELDSKSNFDLIVVSDNIHGDDRTKVLKHAFKITDYSNGNLSKVVTP